MTRRLVAFVLALLLIGVGGSASVGVTEATAQPAAQLASTPPHPGIDVQHYAFALTLADTTDRIVGEATVRLRVTTDTLTVVRLDLVGPTSGRPTGMRLASVTEDGATVDAVQRDDEVRIRPATPLDEGQTRTFVVRYAGIPADGLVIGTNQHGDRTFFGDNWPNRARHWLPVVDHLSDKATVEWTVTAPARYEVVANGALVSDSTTQAGTRTTRWRTDVPLPTKVAVIGVADFAVDSVATVDDVPVQSWVYPQDRERGFADLGQAVDVLRYFEDRLGPYAYEKLANVQSTTRYGGMENASAIFYSEASVADDQNDVLLVAHEVAHHWYGNHVTEADWPHLWLSEGFATYLAGMYLEHTRGADALAQYMATGRRQVLDYAAQHPDTPLVDTTYDDPNELLTVNPYRKGAWVLHMLRARLGDDVFVDGLRAYYERYRGSNATTAQFQAVMEDVSGEDLEGFFDQWTRRAGHPVLRGTWRHDDEAGTCVIDLEQTQDGPPFALDVSVGVTTDRERTETLRLTERSQTFRVDCGRPPSEITLDPNTELLHDGTLTAR